MDSRERIKEAFLDWSYNEDVKQNYRFTLDKDLQCFQPGDRIRLCVCGRPHCQLGTVLSVGERGIIVHTDKRLDISESYSLERIEA